MRHIKTHNLHKDEGGFSLIELLIAITLLVIALIPLASILTTGLRTSVNVSVRASARQYAESEMSKVRDMTFDTVGMAGVTQQFDSAANGAQVATKSGAGGLQSSSTVAGPLKVSFTITRNVTKLIRPLAGNPATKLVTITVSWAASGQNGGGPVTAGSEQLSTEIGQIDMVT